jgi:hypothetical protein
MTEKFQARDNAELGSLDYQGQWQEEKILIQHSLVIGRLKIYIHSDWVKTAIIQN